MLKSGGVRTSLAVLSLVLLATAAFAQVPTSRVVRSAVVVAEPDPDEDASVELNNGTVELLVRGLAPAVSPTPSTSAPAQARARRNTQNRYPSTETAVAWSILKDFALSEASDVSMLLGGPSITDTSALGFNVATTANFNPWFGLTTEGGGSRSPATRTTSFGSRPGSSSAPGNDEATASRFRRGSRER